jgi:two-component system NtrC family sensor kinase
MLVQTKRSASGPSADLDATRRGFGDEEVRLLQAEKLSSIGLLAAGVAHEINNPLAGIMGAVQAIRRGDVPVERQQAYLDAVWDGLERIRLTVRSLLDYARQRPPSITPLDVSEVLDSTLLLVAPAANERHIAMVRIGSELPRGALWADRTQLVQALVNVLLNAIDAAPRRSRVELELLRREDPLGAGFCIRDRGAGIDPAIRHEVCDPFFTTKPQGRGTGLGLSITLAIVKAHGGELDIGAPPDGGTEVTLWLPLRDSAPGGE